MNCGRCKDACIYGVHERSAKDPRVMADPIEPPVQELPAVRRELPAAGADRRATRRSYLELGGGLWTPHRVVTIWNEAQTGKLPVFGAGYRGMFVGPGYDSMWTDMSEIVRPTRDGIHGREFISTSIDLGKQGRSSGVRCIWANCSPRCRSSWRSPCR